MATSKATKEEAAEILARIIDALPLPAPVEGYLRGYVAGLRDEH